LWLSWNNDWNLSTLRVLGLFSPIANMIASRMLDLPEPFGPVIATNPLSKCTAVFLKPNDLKP
jgi:hypothetical protein